eukprot:jgi/Ulvmu1/742/UM010_0115.1
MPRSFSSSDFEQSSSRHAAPIESVSSAFERCAVPRSTGRCAQQGPGNMPQRIAPLAPLAKQPMAPDEQQLLPMRRSHSDSTISSPSPPNDLAVARTDLAVRQLPLTSARQAPETQSLHAICASSTASSTIPFSITGRGVTKGSLRHHPSPPQSEAHCLSIDRRNSFTSPNRDSMPTDSPLCGCEHPFAFSSGDEPGTRQRGPRPMESMIAEVHKSLCHPAICCIFLILHVISLSPPLQPRSAAPTPHTLWITLHLITFCSNLLVIQLYPQATPTLEGLLCRRPEPSRLAGLAFTIPGAAAVLLAALQWPLALVATPAAAASVGSCIASWLLWLELAVQIAATLLNTAYALSVAMVPLAGFLARLGHMLALGGGTAALCAVLPPLLRPPVCAAASIWLACVARGLQAHMKAVCDVAPGGAESAEYCFRVISSCMAGVAAAALPALLPRPLPPVLQRRVHRGTVEVLCRVVTGLMVPALQAALALARQHRIRSLTMLVAGDARSALLGRQVTELESMKRQLLLTATHELNTPLHEVMGCLEALLSAEGCDSLPESTLPFAQTAQSSVFRAARLVRTMMDAVKVERDQLELRRKRVSLPHVLQRLQSVPWGSSGCGACCVSGAEGGGGDCSGHGDSVRPLQVDVDADACFVLADVDRLLQALYELVANGFKFSHGSVRVSAAVTVPGIVTIAVSDSGTGIPADELSRIWGPFHQVLSAGERGASRRSDGLGLGLYLVDQILRAHHAVPRCKSKPGEGTTIEFDLPALSPHAEPPAEACMATVSPLAHTVTAAAPLPVPIMRSQLTGAMRASEAAAAAAGTTPDDLQSVSPPAASESEAADSFPISPRSDCAAEGPERAHAQHAPLAITRPARATTALLSQSAPTSKTLCVAGYGQAHAAPSTTSEPPSAPGSHLSDRGVTATHSMTATHSTACVSPLTDVPFSALVPSSAAARMSLDRWTTRTSAADTSHTSNTEIALVCDLHPAAGAAAARPVGPASSVGDDTFEKGGACNSPPPPVVAVHEALEQWRRLLRLAPPAAVSMGGSNGPHTMCTCGGGCGIAAQLQRLPGDNKGKDTLQDAFFASLGFYPGGSLSEPAAELHVDSDTLPAPVSLTVQELGLPDWTSAAAQPRALSDVHSTPNTRKITARSTSQSMLVKTLDSAAEFARVPPGSPPASAVPRREWGSQSQYSISSTRVCLGSAQCGRRSSSMGAADAWASAEATQHGAQDMFNFGLPSFAPLAASPCPAAAAQTSHSVLELLAARDTAGAAAVATDGEDDGVVGVLSDDEEEAPAPALSTLAMAALHHTVSAARQPAGARSPDGSTRMGTVDSVSSESDAWVSSFVPHAGRAEVADPAAARPSTEQRSSMDICLRRLRGRVGEAATARLEESMRFTQSTGLPPSAAPVVGATPEVERCSASLQLLRAEAAQEVTSCRSSGSAARSFMENVSKSARAAEAPAAAAALEPAEEALAEPEVAGATEAAKLPPRPLPPQLPPEGEADAVLSPQALPRLRLAWPSADAASPPSAALPHGLAAGRRRGTSIDVSLLRRNREAFTGRARGGNAPKILCIDDNAVNQLVISRMLQSAGMHVDKAMSGAEALRKLQEAGDRLPDLLIMDVMMPGINGLDLCRHVRRLYPACVLPTIFVSANSRPEHIVDGFAAGAQDYMAKPINKSELLARVHAQLESKRKIERAAVGIAQQLLERQFGIVTEEAGAATDSQTDPGEC